MRTKPDSPCPCGTGKQYQRCCLPFHNDSSLPTTAEELMRSRYTAFCESNMSYLFNTWHPAFRPAAEEILTGSARYLSLTITDKEKGSADDKDGTVTFTVRFMEEDQLVTMKEKSSFIKVLGKWLYEEGENEIRQETLKKNSPCPCGSGKKFKRCCHSA